MIKEIVIGITSLGVIGGATAIGTLYGLNVFAESLNEANSFGEQANKISQAPPKGISRTTFLVQIDTGSSQTLVCQGSKGEELSLNLVKSDAGDSKAKLICSREGVSELPLSLHIEGNDLTCTSLKEVSQNRTVMCTYPSKQLKFKTVKGAAGEADEIIINWN
ncbi:hypothetical protein MHLP_01340 [Candidatus Mycoplasma haematolamae str. Purdue]|uniref:Uncharacterized protein n=1 Tax=Mycoplasma haematolamae (strain Purdue) TaxID=1212765 RepID=I7BJ35_MYCHA|nr:hypothetical protein [Candidatus Mycoplasma haematolamae]AFO51848.1 hypothetical protein MHLP_01340 [Candidatus Mycoplasma haematolamae str. Purdue]